MHSPKSLSLMVGSFHKKTDSKTLQHPLKLPQIGLKAELNMDSSRKVLGNHSSKNQLKIISTSS